MTLAEFKARIEEKRGTLADPATPDTSVDDVPPEVAGHLAALLRRERTPPSAIDPSFWLTIIQLILPIILEWINRRFPRPTPAPSPVVAPVNPPVS